MILSFMDFTRTLLFIMLISIGRHMSVECLSFPRWIYRVIGCGLMWFECFGLGFFFIHFRCGMVKKRKRERCDMIGRSCLIACRIPFNKCLFVWMTEAICSRSLGSGRRRHGVGGREHGGKYLTIQNLVTNYVVDSIVYCFFLSTFALL